MARLPFAPALAMVLSLALSPADARAQAAPLLDDDQRAAIQEYFQKQAEKAAAADKAKKAREAKDTGKAKKPAVKAPAKKKVEKPKKPAKPKKPKAAQKDKAKDKNAAKANGRNGGKTKPPAARPSLAIGQVLAQDLPRRALPKDLDSKLGKPARGTQRVVVGEDVVLFERKTGRILDVMKDAVKSGAANR